MTALIKRLHNYVGLLNFTMIIVLGLTGLWGLVGVHSSGPTPSGDPWTVPYEAPKSSSDHDVARHLYEHLGLWTAASPAEWAVKRGEDGRLEVRFHGVNGKLMTTVDEARGVVELQRFRASTGAFVTALHLTGVSEAAKNPLMLAWALYLELSIWSLLFMVATGIYLWLVSRPRHVFAWIAFGGGTGAVAVLTVLMS